MRRKGLIDAKALAWGRFLVSRDRFVGATAAEAGESNTRAALAGAAEAVLNGVRQDMREKTRFIDIDNDRHWQLLVLYAGLISRTQRLVDEKKSSGADPDNLRLRQFADACSRSGMEHDVTLAHAVVSGVWPNPPTERLDGSGPRSIKVDTAINKISTDLRRFRTSRGARVNQAAVLREQRLAIEQSVADLPLSQHTQELLSELREQIAYLAPLYDDEP